MTPDITLRLDSLQLTNFRCFERCAIDLDPKLTVVVAENGRGKTTVLDAIRIALGPFVDTISGARHYADLTAADVRSTRRENGEMKLASRAELHAFGFLADKPIEWTRTRLTDEAQSGATSADARILRNLTRELRNSAVHQDTDRFQDAPIIPLVAYYGVKRHLGEAVPSKQKRLSTASREARMSGYSGCLSSSSSVEDTIGWYYTKWTQAHERRFLTEHPEILIQAIEAAMKEVLKPTDWCKLDWDVKQQVLTVEHPVDGRRPLASLSDGIRLTIALVVDIARRCATLNPQLEAAAVSRTPGILLVDEIDAHLHPGWQQQVMDLLQNAFPALQIVVTTHSPHVLSTVDKQSIRIIRLHDGVGLFDTPSFQTRGVESADVLANIMGIDPIPPIDEAKQVREYHALIQQGLYTSKEGKVLRTTLENHFGENHPVILEFERMIRLERLKNKLSSQSKSQ